MADATQAGDDQQTDDSQKPAGEDQQKPSDESQKQPEPQKVLYEGREWTPEELKNELDNTNRAYKRLEQQQGVPQEEAPKPDTADDDGSAEYAKYGLNKEQVAALRQVTGADEMEKKLADYEKREQERQKQEKYSQMEQSFKDLSSKYGDTDAPVPKTPGEKEELLRYMEENNIFNMDVAFREKHSALLNKKEEKPKAAVSDRSDAAEPQSDEAYKQAIARIKKDKPGDLSAIAEVEAQFKGTPQV